MEKIPKENRNLRRIKYLYMLALIYSAYGFVSILTVFSFLIPRKKKYDLILFPYAQKGSDGYKRRFEVYLEQLEKDGLTFKVCHIVNNDRLVKIIDGAFGPRYVFYAHTIWKRTWQVLLARKFKYAFVQRGLFAFYPGQKFPYLEKLLRKLNENITIDFWDADWLSNAVLVNKAASFADKVSCVNDFIMDYYKPLPNKKCLFPIGVDIHPYTEKKDYSIKKELVFIYTGLPTNVQLFLGLIHPVFIKLKQHIDFKLVVITRYRAEINDYKIEYHNFEESTFYHLLASADIGLYYVPDYEESKAKMAMKVLDYMSAALPCIATPIGLSPYAKDHENVMFATCEEDWVEKILFLQKQQELRKNIGANGRQMVEKYHGIQNSYLTFKNIIFDTDF